MMVTSDYTGHMGTQASGSRQGIGQDGCSSTRIPEVYISQGFTAFYQGLIQGVLVHLACVGACESLPVNLTTALFGSFIPFCSLFCVVS